MVPRLLQDLSRADFLKSVGLYVLPDRLFLVRMRKDFLRLAVLAEEAREIAPAEDAAGRRQAFGEALRSLASHFDPAREPLYICLSPDQAVGLQLFLPQAAGDNLTQVLEYEIERHLPFRSKEIYYDFLPLGRKGDKIAVFLFAVPRKILDEVVEALGTLGIRPQGVETTTTALSNYLFFCAGGPTGPALIMGGQEQAWEIIGLNSRGNGWGESRELLFSYRLPHASWAEGPGRAVFHSCLRHAPKFFGWGYVEDLLASVGEESLQFQDLLALGKQRLGADKEMAHSFFLPAVGAALRGLRESSLPANLLPGARVESGGMGLSWLNLCLSALLLIGLIVWGASYPIKDEIRLRQLERENQKLAPAVTDIRKQEDELNRLRGEISLLSGQRQLRGEIFRILDELSRIVPDNAYLLNLRYRDGSVELQGSAENASGLVPLLERSPVFKNVGFTAPSTRGRDNHETFSLKADLERPGAKETKP